MEGWWYEGGGIYRDVWIVKRDPVHIVTDGVFAHPVKVEGEWQLPFEVTVYNSGKAEAIIDVVGDIIDPQKAGILDGAIAKGRATVTVPPLGTVTVNIPMVRTWLFQTPRLWSPESPELYWAGAYIVQGGHWRGDTQISGRWLDEAQTNVGFRTQRYDAQKGFFLNDKPVKIKGVCLHQDHAGVGTAVPAGIIDYRLRRLKELGCNAIRFSHNAQSKALMDACDRHGFLVMAENRNFNASPDYLKQLEWLVRRDRNHPCVYMWSVFNEEPMQGTEQGYEMVRRMSAVVKSLDTSRPVTA
eukprot:gene32982-42398_t